jgi:hypothetical protein
MEEASNPPSSQISETNRATVAVLRRIFEPLTGLLNPDTESVLVYDAAAQSSSSSQSETAK